MARYILRRWLTVPCVAAALLGCSPSDTRVSSDTASLVQYVSLGVPPKAVRFELATLPESNVSDGGLPGPTDYVALIAAIALHESESKRITDQPRYTGQQPIPEAFLRTWLSDSEKTALREALFQKGGLAYDVSRLATRPTKRAAAIPVDPEHWVLYLEYASP